MKVRVLRVGKSGCAWADQAVSDYARRLKRHLSLEDDWVKVERYRGDVKAVRVAEAARIMRRVGPRDRLVVLDERGESPTTEAFAAMLDQGRSAGVHRITFVIGGAYGHDASLRESAWKVMRLSSLVLNHELARVVLYEQLYRGMSLLSGSPYHH